jgi:DNA-directed RNA polymerase subunit RPC12/RpoP
MQTLWGELEEETKFCKKCNRNLTISKFGKASGGNYLYCECKECSNKLSKIRKKLREEYPLVDAENYKCPICKRNFEEIFGTGGKRLKHGFVVDHDHQSNFFRGYICHSCNRGLGVFQDSIEILKNAIDYLEKSKLS